MLVMAGVILLSNILVQYPLGTWLTYGALTYPLAFLVTDIVNRLCGVDAAKRVIVIGFLTGVFASLVASQFDVTTLRIAIASGTAFVVAQMLDVYVFSQMRHLPWWQGPTVSSTLGSLLDTMLFFSIAFSAFSFSLIPDVNDWALASVPLLGVGPVLPLWVSLALADLGIKLLMVMVLLLPYRFFTKK
jgi:queuosine precursor transporter